MFTMSGARTQDKCLGASNILLCSMNDCIYNVMYLTSSVSLLLSFLQVLVSVLSLRIAVKRQPWTPDRARCSQTPTTRTLVIRTRVTSPTATSTLVAAMLNIMQSWPQPGHRHLLTARNLVGIRVCVVCDYLKVAFCWYLNVLHVEIYMYMYMS